MNNYTHILSIRLWNNNLKIAIKNDELENCIKSIFIENEQIYNGVKIVWRKKELSPLEKAFNKGDIVIISSLECDEMLLNATREVFIDINNYLHDNKLLTKDSIATFTITKPLTSYCRYEQIDC